MIADNKTRAGFTLLEMLVVISIIAIVSGALVLSLSAVTRRDLAGEAERLQIALQMASDEAVFQGHPMGVIFTKDSYEFLRYDSLTRRWLPVNDKSLRARQFPAIRMRLTIGNIPVTLAEVAPASPQHPSILLSSEGEVTPFDLSLSLPDQGMSFILSTDGFSALSLHEDERRQ